MIVRKTRSISGASIDRNSRKIIGCFMGDRTRKSARKLWADLPEVYQQYDERLYRFLAGVTLQLFPLNVTLAVGKETGLTNHIERLNNTFRQRVSRARERKPIILKKVEQSYWSDLVLHSGLQCRAEPDLSLTTTSDYHYQNLQVDFLWQWCNTQYAFIPIRLTEKYSSLSILQ